jgi:hypothetical protein
MTVLEMEVGDSFVGLDDAETRLSPAAQGARNVGLLLFLGAAQLAWLGTLGYFTYVFVS